MWYVYPKSLYMVGKVTTENLKFSTSILILGSVQKLNKKVFQTCKTYSKFIFQHFGTIFNTFEFSLWKKFSFSIPFTPTPTLFSLHWSQQKSILVTWTGVAARGIVSGMDSMTFIFTEGHHLCINFFFVVRIPEKMFWFDFPIENEVTFFIKIWVHRSKCGTCTPSPFTWWVKWPLKISNFQLRF